MMEVLTFLRVWKLPDRHESVETALDGLKRPRSLIGRGCNGTRQYLACGILALQMRQNGVTCQTSDGYSITRDVSKIINEVRGRGGSCPNTTSEASGKSAVFQYITTKINADSLSRLHHSCHSR